MKGKTMQGRDERAPGTARRRGIAASALAWLGLAMLLGLSACAMAGPMSPGEFHGQCLSYNGGAPDRGAGCSTGPQDSICQSFTAIFDQRQPSRAACQAQCRAMSGTQQTAHVADGCYTAAVYAGDVCDRYCRTNYP